MSFSSVLKLTDLNDYITPSQACIKPIETIKQTDQTAQVIITENEYYQVSKDGIEKLAPTTISLNDCLACSGCITSAESVLITQQSHLELIEALSVLYIDFRRKRVLSVSLLHHNLLLLSQPNLILHSNTCMGK